MIHTHYNTIYLSPHLDDAALSCGGQIFAQTAAGQSVLIVTIMAGDPPAVPLSDFAHSLHERWELALDIVAGRRAEDVAACQTLGADYAHWPTPDCIYRPHPDTGALMYVSWDDIIGSVPAAESALIDKLARQMTTLPHCSRILAPLTVGHHVDHQLTRAAAEHCFGDNLFYYEDYPYVREPGALHTVIPENQAGWQAEVIPLSNADLAAKIEAIAAFASQLSTFFDGRAGLEKQIRSYARKAGGERIWRRRPPDLV